jgi:hypothetical protein
MNYFYCVGESTEKSPFYREINGMIDISGNIALIPEENSRQWRGLIIPRPLDTNLFQTELWRRGRSNCAMVTDHFTKATVSIQSGRCNGTVAIFADVRCDLWRLSSGGEKKGEFS